MLALVAPALAAALRLTPSPGATVELVTPVEPGKAEILVRGNTRDLKPGRGATLPEDIRSWSVRNAGGAWVVTVWLRDESDQLSLVKQGDTWVLDTVPLMPIDGLSFVTATALDTLLADGATPSTCAEPAAPPATLVPLIGRDARYTERLGAWVPRTERWSDAEPNGGDALDDDERWAAVEKTRRSLASGVPVAERPVLLYRLGALHRDLGHLREAAYYFGQADATGAPRGIAALQKAEALARLGRADDAKDAVLAARHGGAGAGHVAELLAALALAGGAPDPVGLARLVAEHATEAHDLRLAGLLLLREGCTAEAAVHLAKAVAKDPDDARARLLLVDSLLARGQVADARGAVADLAEGGVPPELRAARRARARVLVLLGQSPDQWPAMVPTLELSARIPGEEGDEALYLLGQLGEHLAETRLALDSWVTLVDRDRDFAAGEPGRRLYGVWWSRVRALVADGRDVDALTFHVGAWRPGLAAHLHDPAALRQVARTYAGAGLGEPALELWRAVADWEGIHQVDDRPTVLAMAELYRTTGHAVEAAEALDFLASRTGDAGVDARGLLLRGRLAEDAGDLAGARTWFAKVTSPPAVATEARLRGALLDARDGRCDVALAGLVAPEEGLPTDVSEAVVVALRARCLTATGRAAEGREVAAAAARLLADEDAVGWAAYAAGPALPLDQRPTEGVWARLGAEDAADAAMKARVGNLRR